MSLFDHDEVIQESLTHSIDIEKNQYRDTSLMMEENVDDGEEDEEDSDPPSDYRSPASGLSRNLTFFKKQMNEQQKDMMNLSANNIKQNIIDERDPRRKQIVSALPYLIFCSEDYKLAEADIHVLRASH